MHILDAGATCRRSRRHQRRSPRRSFYNLPTPFHPMGIPKLGLHDARLIVSLSLRREFCSERWTDSTR